MSAYVHPETCCWCVDSLRAGRDALKAENAELKANYENLEMWCRPLEGLLDEQRNVNAMLMTAQYEMFDNSSDSRTPR